MWLPFGVDIRQVFLDDPYKNYMAVPQIGSPYSKSPTILGSILVPLVVGNSHVWLIEGDYKDAPHSERECNKLGCNNDPLDTRSSLINLKVFLWALAMGCCWIHVRRVLWAATLY